VGTWLNTKQHEKKFHLNYFWGIHFTQVEKRTKELEKTVRKKGLAGARSISRIPKKNQNGKENRRGRFQKGKNLDTYKHACFIYEGSARIGRGLKSETKNSKKVKQGQQQQKTQNGGKKDPASSVRARRTGDRTQPTNTFPNESPRGLRCK